MDEDSLIPISEAARRLDVSIDTLRRWDESGRLRAVRKSPGGNRYYREKDLDFFLHNILILAHEWAAGATAPEIPKLFYCPSSPVFQSRLIKMQNLLEQEQELQQIFSLLVAVAGEIGNNSFDHNLGNWPDVPGIFFGYDIADRAIALADRGLGVLTTLQRVRPQLNNHEDALRVAFTEVVTSRSPEKRGNGLKFVKRVIEESPIGLQFQSGDAQLEIIKPGAQLEIKKVAPPVRGCLAFITW